MNGRHVAWHTLLLYDLVCLLPAEADPPDDIFSSPLPQEGPGSGDIRPPDSFQPKIALSLV